MAVNPMENLRAALQYLLDSEGDGWQLNHYTVVLGIEKMDASGAVSSTTWMVVPQDQPDYVTDGLVSAAWDMRANAEIADSDD